jgi:hypothetical protein
MPANITMKTERSLPVTAFACFAFILVLIGAYCTDRNGAVDEPGFLNPPYMLAHYGHLTFPTYAYNGFFDLPVITHPPVHLMWIGLLWRLGLPVYYAEATPTVLLLLLGIAVVLYGPFPVPVKLGWLFAIGFLGASGDTLTECFGSRPEGEVQAAWFCGLLLLEAGRIADWNWRWLCAGAMFLTWASGTHYYAGPACGGVLVYMVWAVRSLGWKEAKPRVAALFAGACLFAVPYLAFYAIPYFHEIRDTIRNVTGQGGVGLSVRRHLDLYRIWVRESYHPALVREGMATGIPLLVFSTAILAAIPSTRGIAMAALPLQLGIFLLVWRKMSYYVVHESVLFAAAVSIGLLALCLNVVARWRPKWEPGFASVAALALAIYLVEASPMLGRVRVTFRPMAHEMEVAHAAGRRMLGPHARVGGRWWGWYASGAEHWFDVERDLVLGALTLDPATYLANLDAIELCPSIDAPGRVPGWYASGMVQLRGFFFAQTDGTLSCVQLSSRRTAPLVGYAAWDGMLYRFQEDGGGGYEVLSAVCERGGEDWNKPPEGIFAVGQDIADGPEAGRRIVTVLAPRSSLAPAGAIGRSCREVSRVRGTLVLDDWRSLVERSRRDDPVMRFYRGVEDLPGYGGVGLSEDAIPPRDAVPAGDAMADLDNAVASGAARLERVPQVRLTTIPVMGGFSAYIPVEHAETAPPAAWITLRLRVRRGRIGFGTLPWNPSVPVRTKAIASSPEPQTVAVYTPDLRHTAQIVVFNESLKASEVDIFDAGVLVRDPAKGNAGKP